jgi:hypothetical protein
MRAAMTIFVLYADCGTGGQLQEKCKELGVEMIEGPHCYSFFEGNAAFAAKAETEFTAFYLTDFLVRQFDAFVWRPMGSGPAPELRDMYFGNYTKLVYQAQTDDPALDAKARDCAARLGLAYERRFTGYGDLETALPCPRRRQGMSGRLTLCPPQGRLPPRQGGTTWTSTARLPT